MDTSMRDSDAFAWFMERDPSLRATIVGVAWLERSPDWDTLVAKIDRATGRIPLFRQRVVEAAGRFRTPRWTDDEAFDLTLHVHRMDSPEPHTPATAIEVARVAAVTPFDRAHPLWDFTLVEHLAGNRAALVMKVHHALTDGVGSMQLALELFDLEAAPASPDDSLVDAPEPPTPGRDDFASAWSQTVASVRNAAQSAVRAATRVARNPGATAAASYETLRSVGRVIAPVRETRSPIMKGRSEARHLDMLEVRLKDLKRAGTAAGGSLNDAFMAAATGGLRRYHDEHRASVDELRVTLPISLRTPDDPPGGNHITLIRFTVAVSDVDPASRIRAMRGLCRTARDERSLRYTGAIAGVLNLLPRGFIGGMLKHIDFLASNIPGFPFPVYLAGIRMERYVAFGPTTGTAVNLALMSYDGTCCVGISIDTAAVDDPDVLVECIREGFEEVLALGGPHDPVRMPLRAAARA